ncbi:MAG: hypothetical protein A2275_09975 [Bacteroidetes bacterium RIFOXYA12_FULL_35_11]|nr:MAG: hypothetical protein A2X01_09870 [Bacteroidetes bacterium GWF2_35_48]OFY83226.1 MAG: hypothetical protein A2275_09975 [Bacteroidetes bacterium RIFOXYA12_FULL_35_11]OFY94458.1 MAG: hypothetical protein A2309_08850 [Bacteroidetes bacterium RIFOXYB2_FULL_35_7]OFY97924.1 MAG: hypothetical protein A2491_18225 [Bacteroidetes bacterium RIFOXYC12_FULL_35_7]
MIIPILFFYSFSLFSLSDKTKDNIPEVIITAIKTGNAKELAKYFNQNVELVILNQEDVYSKAQAELIIKDFFAKNTPSDFSVLHQGGKEGARFAVGEIKTNNGNYRIFFLLKIINEQPYIHQFRVEKQ